jgi:signal transduction histidine kinase
MASTWDSVTDHLDSTSSDAPSGKGGHSVDAELVLTFAHEIRNILAPLCSSSDLLLMPDVDARSKRRAAEVISRQVRQLRRLTNDLLDVQRIDLRELQLVRRSVDMKSAVEAICEDHRPAFKVAGIDLSMHGPNGPLMLNVDLDRIEQVINNLLSNSLKFTDRGGRVSMSLFVDGVSRRVVIAVRDTGVGIDSAMLDAIMRQGIHDLSCRNRTGLGLGLPLVKRLVEMHGGELSVSSDGIGHGSEFRVLLPLIGTGNLDQR